MKLQLKILLPIIILLTVLLAVSGAIAHHLSSSSLKTAIIAHMADAAENMRRLTNTTMRSLVNDIARTTSNQTIVEFASGNMRDLERAKALTPHLTRLVDSYDNFARITILDTKGQVVASSAQNTIGSDFSTRIHFTEGMRGRSHITAPYKSAITGETVMIAAAPVFVDGKVAGVMYGTVPMDAIYEQVVKNVKIGAQGYGYLVDQNGQIVAINPTHADWLFNPDLPSVALYKGILTGPDGATTAIGNDGREVQLYHINDRETGLMSVVRAEPDDVFASLAQMRNISIGIVLVAILLGALVVTFLVRPIVRALSRGVVFAKEIAEGRLNARLDINRNDEIGQLGQALRTIPTSLNDIIAEYGKLEKRVEAGELGVKGDALKFSGDFAKLVEGTNSVLDHFRGIIDNIPSPVIIFDKDLRASYVNKATRELVGENYRGKSCFELMAREDFNGPDCALRRAVESKRIAVGETVARPGGQVMDISYTVIPLLDADRRIVAVMQLITDLTTIKRTQRTIMEVAGQATDISNRVAAASEVLSAQVVQVSSGAGIQRDRAASTATAMEEMNSSVLEVARNAGLAREGAEHTQVKANEGASLVRQVVEAIEQVNAVAQELERNMQDLGAQAGNIDSVVNVISDIADQTNLLALNAAIEAARAGEAGRGFAVVADEVRKLAEKTMGATSEVGTSIRGVQASTARNIERVGEAAKGVAYSTKLASTSGEALAEILKLASGNAELVASIATAAEKQSATSEEINRSLDEISNIAGETASGMADSTQAVSDLTDMAKRLNTLLERLQKS